MGKKILFVIDMQKDFIDGTLGSEDARLIVPNVVKLINDFRKDNPNGMIFSTIDTHDENYLKTLEGKKLPISHCIRNTEGWKLNKDVKEEIEKHPNHLIKYFYKNSFGSIDMVKEASLYLWNNIDSDDECIVVGLCTDICVISNVLLLRAKFPYLKITCYEKCCAGTSKEAHNAAKLIMKVNQIDVV